MSDQLQISTRDALVNNGDAMRISGDKLIGQPDAPNGLETEDNPTLRAGNQVPVYARKVDADSLLAIGFGTNNRNRGRRGFTHARFKADGTGTGTDGDDITDGTLWARITDPRRRYVKKSAWIGSLDDLSEAYGSQRTEKPMQPVMEPAAQEDRWVEYAILAGPDADGKVVDSDSLIKLYNTDIDLS